MYLALDQAEHTGYAVYDKNEKLIKFGMYQLKGNDYIDRAIDLERFILHMKKEYKIKFIIFENIFFFSVNSYDALRTYNSMIKIVCRKNKIPYQDYLATEWRSILKIKKDKKAAMQFVKDTFDIILHDDNTSDAICIGYAHLNKPSQ